MPTRRSVNYLPMTRHQLFSFFTYWVCLMGFLMCFDSVAVHAQEQHKVIGYLFEKPSERRVNNVNIRNLRTGNAVSSDHKGEFSIQGRLNDTLLVSKLGYKTLRIPIDGQRTFRIQIQPVSQMLDEVSIKQHNREDQLQDVLEGYRKHGVYSEGKPGVLNYIFQPITALYERFSRRGRQARRFRSYMNNELEAQVVDRMFSVYRVQQLTELDDEDLANFLLLYRPDYLQVQHWTEYDAMHYIMKSFRLFDGEGRPQAPKLPDLTHPLKDSL